MLDTLKGEAGTRAAPSGMLSETSSIWPVKIPEYLQDTYWWAYVHPNAIAFWDRQWLINLILFGNFIRLRDTALSRLGGSLTGRTLQIACVYGDFSVRVADRISPGGSLDVVDVVPGQLQNLRRKLPANTLVRTIQRDSTSLQFDDASYDQVILFFLLHEQPDSVRRQTLSEAVRVLKPGGKLLIVDYHRPALLHPLRTFLQLILLWLEPFAMDIWRNEVISWFPADFHPKEVRKETTFGGMYQIISIQR